MKHFLLLFLAAGLLLPGTAFCSPAAAPPDSTSAGSRLEESLCSLESEVLPALESVKDRASAEAAVARLEKALPHVQLITRVLTAELSPAEEAQYLPVLAPRMKTLLAQLDSCCRLSAEMLSSKPAAFGSERLALALTGLLDAFMAEDAAMGKARTLPQDIPLALAEADAQVATMHGLLASLERLQGPESVEAELPAIREQIQRLRELQRGLADSARWSRTQLFLIMQRLKLRGAEVTTDLGRCVARLLGLSPACYGSAELEDLLNDFISSPSH